MLELCYKYTWGCVTEYIIQIYKEEETKTQQNEQIKDIVSFLGKRYDILSWIIAQLRSCFSGKEKKWKKKGISVQNLIQYQP